jgi:aminopeptidase N
VNALHDAILSDKFWSVGVEAAKSLGTIKENYAYDALKDVLAKVKDPRAKRAVVGALGEFRRNELFGLLKPILESSTESYAVQSEAATAIGKLKEAQQIPMLESLIDGEETYLDLLAQGAIAGLKEFAGDKKVASIILKRSEYGHRSRIREAATLALAKFAPSNTQIVDHLRFHLLRDKWFRIRKNACKALAEAEITDSISDLQWVGEHDIDAGVRRVADECTLILKDKLELTKQGSQLKPVRTGQGPEDEAEEKATKSRKMHIGFLNKIDRFESHDR